MNVNPGELNKRIQIYKKTYVTDDDGYKTPSEKLVRSCYAKFSRISGTELTKADADFAEVKARFLVRYSHTPINRKMFVRYGGNDYEITYVNDYEDKHEYIEIWAKLVTNAG